MKSNWLKWVSGRQDGRYKKKMYLRFVIPGFLGMDAYCLILNLIVCFQLTLIMSKKEDTLGLTSS